jgi:hypothetical protein
MVRPKAVAAAFAAALLTVGAGVATSAGSAYANSGAAHNGPTVIGGTNSVTVIRNLVTVTGGVTANSGSTVSNSPVAGGTTIAAVRKIGGNAANASNRGQSKSGGVTITF